MSLPPFEDHHGDPEKVAEGWWEKLARTIAVDFDGVIHPYTAGWQGSKPVDEPPCLGVVEFLQWCRDHKFRVVVFSTRANHLEGKSGIVDYLQEYFLLDYVDDVTHEKPPAIAYVDDRAVPYHGDWDTVRKGVSDLAYRTDPRRART